MIFAMRYVGLHGPPKHIANLILGISSLPSLGQVLQHLACTRHFETSSQVHIRGASQKWNTEEAPTNKNEHQGQNTSGKGEGSGV